MLRMRQLKQAAGDILVAWLVMRDDGCRPRFRNRSGSVPDRRTAPLRSKSLDQRQRKAAKMAMQRADTWNEDWVRKAFLEDYAWKPTFFDMMKPRCPTEDSIRLDVEKLRSPSRAGKTWIADRRMAIASVGPWRDVYVFPRKEGGYPAIITRARREGVTYEISTRLTKA